MATEIKFYGIAAYEITLHDGRVVLVDPCLDENPACPIKAAGLERVDLVLVSHLAADHLGDTAAVAKKFQCPVVCGAEVKYFLCCQGLDPKQIRTVPWHGQVNPLEIRIRSVPSMHSSMAVAPDGQWLSGQPMGFIIYADDDCRIYHSGDSAIFSDLKLIGLLYRPNVGLLCACELEQEYLHSLGIEDHYSNEMSGDEGALAASWMRLEYALCCHYLSPEDKPDVEKFNTILNGMNGPKPVILYPGQVFTYPPEGD